MSAMKVAHDVRTQTESAASMNAQRWRKATWRGADGETATSRSAMRPGVADVTVGVTCITLHNKDRDGNDIIINGGNRRGRPASSAHVVVVVVEAPARNPVGMRLACSCAHSGGGSWSVVARPRGYSGGSACSRVHVAVAAAASAHAPTVGLTKCIGKRLLH